jgi:4-diphosphocytidyl-2-C-methyl-D-erythritol kinase
VGAGLGGGSSDAAFTLRMLDEKFNLSLSDEQLLSYASGLGSDCAFFLLNKPCYASGRGELLTEISINLSDYTLLLVNPGIMVSTAKAFSMITPSSPARPLQEVFSLPISEWKNNLINDFEMPVFKMFPEIQEIKEKLYASGAIYASMTGSGSSVFALFENDKPLPEFSSSRTIQL